MICEPEIIVGAQIEHIAPRHGHMRPLGRVDLMLLFEQTVSLDLGQGCIQMIKKSSGHNRVLLWRMIYKGRAAV